MKELYNNVEITMNSISKEKFNKNYEDLTFEETRIVHNIFFTN
jgi:hypothetical protein